MLSEWEITRVRAAFSVFDHEWMFYSTSRGEPYLVDDCLVYFDGVLLCVCAYQLSNVWDELVPERLSAIVVGRPEFVAAQGVCVWGRYRPIERLDLGPGRSLPRASYRDYDVTFVDSVVDMTAFDLASNREARLAANAARRGGLAVHVVQRTALGSEHLALIAEWGNTHDISMRSAGVLAGLPMYVREQHVHLVECRNDDALVGFAIVALQGSCAIYVQGFSRRIAGLRIGDALYCGMIAFANARGVQRLHLGYSPTPSLARFKRKWGGRMSGPPFRDSLFTSSAALSELFEQGRFRWHERLSSKLPLPVVWPTAR